MDAPETLEEKIARVMRGISSMTPQLPSSSPQLPAQASNGLEDLENDTDSFRSQNMGIADAKPVAVRHEEIHKSSNSSSRSNSTLLKIPVSQTIPELPLLPNVSVATPETADVTHESGNSETSISFTGRKKVDLVEGVWSLAQLRKESPTVKNTVSVRIRPFIGNEVEDMGKQVVAFKESQVIVANPNALNADPNLIADVVQAVHVDGWASVFSFDNLMWSCSRNDSHNPYVNQHGVHRIIGSELVEYVLNGISSTCIAYGHTKSGKTHTLFGDDFSVDSGKHSIPKVISERSGLVPRVISDVVNSIRRLDGCCDDTRMTLSFLEVYNDKIRDLLSTTLTEERDSLRIRENPTFGSYVEGLSTMEINSSEAALSALVQGIRNRADKQSHWNIDTSRSHIVVTLELAPRSDEVATTTTVPATPTSQSNLKRRTPKKAVAKPDENSLSKVRLNFVDLAGSERDYVSFNNASAKQKPSATELKLIRSSLSSLGFIIKSISRGVGSGNKVLPFRDCVLTSLLRESLETKGFVSCVATVSPWYKHYEETISTLRFAEEIYAAVHKADQKEHNGSKAGSELERLQTSLGDDMYAEASSVLLKATVSDPQQRLQKWRNQLESKGDHRKPTEKASEVESLGSDRKAYEELQGAYRLLQGQLVELQIELDTTRTDRDSYLVDLRATKDLQLASSTSNANQSNSFYPTSGSNSNVQSNEIEKLREVIARKEEMIEKLLVDLTESKSKAERLSGIIERDKQDFTSQLESLKREHTATCSELKIAKRNESDAKAELGTVMSECEKLRSGFEECSSRFLRCQDDLTKSNAVNQSLRQEISSLKGAYTAIETAERGHAVDMSKLKAELMGLTAERDGLVSQLAQQRAHIALQAKRTEDSLKSIWNRQETMERVEKDADYSLNQLQTVQEGLQGLVMREGIVLHSELLGVKKLLGLLGSVRERLQDINKVRSDLESERLLRTQLEEESRLLQHDSAIVDGVDAPEIQIARYREACQASEARANHWQSIAQQLQTLNADSAAASLAKENEELRLQLAAALSDAAVANAALEKSQETMQSEFSSLWLAVQELNKLDAAKEDALAELIDDRARVLAERDSGLKKFHELSIKYASLQQDLETIDRDLVAAAEAEQIQIPLYINDHPHMPEVPVAVEVVRSTPAQQERSHSMSLAPPLIETVVTKQIKELSGFLNSDRNKHAGRQGNKRR